MIFFCRQSDLSLSSSIESSDLSANEAESRSKIKELNKEARSCENASSVVVIPSTFKNDLSDRLRQIGAFNRNDYNNGIVQESILQSKFQADSLITYRVLHGFSDFVISNDSDFVNYIGYIIITISFYSWSFHSSSPCSLALTVAR